MGKFPFSKKVFKPSHWRSLRNLSLKNRKSMGKFFERFSLDLKITANQRETVSKKPVSKKPEIMGVINDLMESSFDKI